MITDPAIRKQLIQGMGARLLQDNSFRIKLRAAETLAKLGDQDGVPYLLAALENVSDEDFFYEITNFIQMIIAAKPEGSASTQTKYDLRGANIGNLADTVQRDQQTN
jgi:hypothetical protein